MDYVSTSFVAAGFLVVFSLVYYLVASQLGGGAEGGKKSRLVDPKFYVQAFGFLYLVLAFAFLLVAVGNSLFLTNQAPCENVINTTLLVNGTTTYTYADSCADREVPASSERLYVILGYVLLLQVIMLAIGLLIMIVEAIRRW